MHRRWPPCMHRRAGAGALLVDHDIDVVAVLHPDSLRRLSGADVAAVWAQELDSPGVERVLAAVQVHEPPQRDVALDAEEDVRLKRLALHLDVDDGPLRLTGGDDDDLLLLVSPFDLLVLYIEFCSVVGCCD